MINAAPVSHNWIDLNVSTGKFNCSRRIIAMRSDVQLIRSGVPFRAYHLVLTAVFTLVTAFAVFETVPAVLLMSNSSL
jgi:hypothetical protein